MSFPPGGHRRAAPTRPLGAALHAIPAGGGTALEPKSAAMTHHRNQNAPPRPARPIPALRLAPGGRLPILLPVMNVMGIFRLWAAGLFLLAAGFWPAPAAAERVTVFAAASLMTALDEVAVRFEAETGHEVTLSYAGSSVLARQVARGAPADVVISANPGWMDWLEDEGLIAQGTRAAILGNRLALIAHGHRAAPAEIGPGTDLAALVGQGRLAMALVDAVPAGIYGKAALTRLGQWGALRPRVVQTDNVRAALKLVSIGEAGFGVVYATDAMADPAVALVGLFPEDSHPPIRYPAAAVAGRAGPAARAFLAHLQGPGAAAIFERHGFSVPGG